MDIPVNPPLRLLAAFQDVFPGATPDHIVQAPGREMWVAAVMRDHDEFTLHAPDAGSGRAVFNWRSAKLKRTILNRPLPRWARYPAGVIMTLCASGLDTVGFDAVVAGEEPEGPRYDYGMGMAVAALLYTIHQKAYTADSLLEVVEQVRRDYIGG